MFRARLERRCGWCAVAAGGLKGIARPVLCLGTCLAVQNQGLLGSGVEQAVEFRVLVVAELVGENGALAGAEEDLPIVGQAHGLVRGQQGAPAEMGVAAVTGGAVALGVVRGGEGTAVGLEGDRAVTQHPGKPLGRLQVGRGRDLDQSGIGEEGAGGSTIGGAQLGEILQDRPELQAEAGHQPGGLQHRLKAAESGELVEQQHGRGAGVLRCAGETLNALGDEQAEPAGISTQPVGWQDQEHRGAAVVQVVPLKIAARHGGGEARAVEQVGMALGGGEYAGGLAVGLAELARGGAGNQPARSPGIGQQGAQQRLPVVGRQGEPAAEFRQATAAWRAAVGEVQQQAGEQCPGLLVPMRLGNLTGRVKHQRLGQRRGFVGEIGRGGVEQGGRIEGAGGLAGDAEGIEHMHWPEAPPGAGTDTGILTLGIDTTAPRPGHGMQPPEVQSSHQAMPNPYVR